LELFKRKENTMLIRTFQDISCEWLQSLLGVAGKIVTSFHVAASWETPVTQVAIVEVRYSSNEDDSPSKLFVKIPKANQSDGLIGLGEREIQFYREVLPEMKVNYCPRVYSAVYDKSEGSFNLVLENLADTHFQTEWPIPPSIEHCTMAVECLAKVHAYWWDNQSLESATGPFESQETILTGLGALEKLNETFFEFLGDRISAERIRMINGFFKNAGQFSRRYRGHKDFTLVHNDAHVWNFLFPKDNGQEVKLIDWQCFIHGIGASDLAYMMAVHWYPERRRKYEMMLLGRYHEMLVQCGVHDYTFEQLLRDYKWCVIGALSLPLLQWSIKLPAAIWLNHLERICLAYEDLGCADFAY
jgi:hypothetical protein